MLFEKNIKVVNKTEVVGNTSYVMISLKASHILACVSLITCVIYSYSLPSSYEDECESANSEMSISTP
jgi:hypothetical protein